MPFINDEIAAAYEETPRFDEGHFSNDPEFDALYRRYLDVEDAIAVNFSQVQLALLDRRLEFEREICEFEFIRILDKNLSYQLGLLAQYCVIVTCHTYNSMAAFRCLVLHQYPGAADEIFSSRIRISHYFEKGWLRGRQREKA